MANTEKVKQLKKFIKDNNLQFTVGRRNSDCTTISGYALYIDADEDDIIEAIKTKYNKDSVLQEELSCVFNYANMNGYGNWWKTEEAKKEWFF